MTFVIEQATANEATRADKPTLSWACAFCSMTRIFEGGRPELFKHLDTCPACGSRVVVRRADGTAMAGLIDRHLL